MDYRVSHTAGNKGKTYDESFSVSDYRQFISEWENKVLNKIVAKYVIRKENYLDFACGTGRITKLIEQYFVNSFGVDISETMLKEARKKVLKAKIIQQDITSNNPFLKDQMDLITSFRFFLNAEQTLRSEVLTQLNIILKQNGHLVFNIHNNRTFISNTIDKFVITKKKIGGNNFQPQNSISIREIRQLLKKHDFEIVRMYHRAVIPLKGETSKFKISKYSKIEDFFSNISLLRNISKNIIFVCKKL